MLYTNAFKKECPGPYRVSQVPTIFARANTSTATKPLIDAVKTTVKELGIMENITDKDAEKIALKILQWPVRRGGKEIALIQELADIKTEQLALKAAVARITKKLGA